MGIPIVYSLEIILHYCTMIVAESFVLVITKFVAITTVAIDAIDATQPKLVSLIKSVSDAATISTSTSLMFKLKAKIASSQQVLIEGHAVCLYLKE